MKLVRRFVVVGGLLVLLASPLALPVVGSASAAVSTPIEDGPDNFGSGLDDPADQTTDPDEPFDGLDRIVISEPQVKVVKAPSFLERFLRLMRSIRMLKG